METRWFKRTLSSQPSNHRQIPHSCITQDMRTNSSAQRDMSGGVGCLTSYTINVGQNILYRNNGNGTFENVAEGTGLHQAFDSGPGAARL
ncbi:MAG: hypothetical protein M2R45_00803 [Verrucomicrobia subdivision 3 bacterium]|nr:hypothetical protein [Limisphaerales bacterium]MCS1413092.1 hypothetical protein [Limisphaerales bacterium]